MQKAHKAVHANHSLHPLQRHIVQSKEIRVHSRLFQTRYKGCTNARFILSRRIALEKFINENALSVQRAHKFVRTGQCLLPVQRRIVQSMEIRIHSRLFLARNKGCTYAWRILSRSYRHKEFKNRNALSVQKVHKFVRTGQCLRPL